MPAGTDTIPSPAYPHASYALYFLSAGSMKFQRNVSNKLSPMESGSFALSMANHLLSAARLRSLPARDLLYFVGSCRKRVSIPALGASDGRFPLWQSFSLAHALLSERIFPSTGRQIKV